MPMNWLFIYEEKSNERKEISRLLIRKLCELLANASCCFSLRQFTKQTPSAEHEYKRFFPTKYRVDDFITKISFFQTFTELKIFFVSEERSRKWSATHLYCNHCLSSSINATILSDSFFGFLFKSLSLFTMLNICFFSTIYESRRRRRNSKRILLSERNDNY